MYRKLCARKPDLQQAEDIFHTFRGNLDVVDLADIDAGLNDFPGAKWLEGKIRNRQPIGWDLEWPPDRSKEANNPIALMQFADHEYALLIRTHRSERWLPSVVRQALLSDTCTKICVGWDGADKKKMKISFELEPLGLLDLSVVASQKGLRERGLKALAEHFGFRIRKETRVARSNWAVRELTTEQEMYAAEDAYFTYLLKEKLESLPDIEEESVNLAVEGQLALREGWAEAGIVRRHDGLHCELCHQGPMNTQENVESHLRGSNHAKKTKAKQGPVVDALTEEQESNGIFAGDGTNGVDLGQYKCRLCDTLLTCTQNIDSHIKSKKHQKVLSPPAEEVPKDPFAQLWNVPDYVEFNNQELSCTLCSTKAASVRQMHQHLHGTQHHKKARSLKKEDVIYVKEKDRLEFTESGKPVVRTGFKMPAKDEARATRKASTKPHIGSDEEELPDGWACSIDEKTNRPYYWMVADRTKVQWEPPGRNSLSRASTAASSTSKHPDPLSEKQSSRPAPTSSIARNSLPDLWEEHETDDGRKYYYCLKTHKSQWHHPCQGQTMPKPGSVATSTADMCHSSHMPEAVPQQTCPKEEVARFRPEHSEATTGLHSQFAASQRSEQLPPGWQRVVDDKTGRTYFWDAECQAASWTPPEHAEDRVWTREENGEGACWVCPGTADRPSISFWESDASWHRRQDCEGRIYWSHPVFRLRFFEPVP
ncbi:unnamed protein product [Effrenium voratum]|nr:unnamed protein product [Effrenium voratum]